MSLFAIAAFCAAIAGGGLSEPAGTGYPIIAHRHQVAIPRVSSVLLTPDSRDAIARVAYAEAGNQGDSGLAGVVYAILNRLIDGGWGSDVEAVLNAPGQFEPVTRAGGWRHLPIRSAVEQAHIDTILNLALDGRLPDPTNGARFFQNPAIVGSRAAVGLVSRRLVNFGGQKPLAVIKDHAFYGEDTKPLVTESRRALVVPMKSGSGEPIEPVISGVSQPTALFVPLSR